MTIKVKEKLIIIWLYELGLLESLASNYEDSIYYSVKSLEILEGTEEEIIICQITMNLFLPYISLKEYGKSIKICKSVLNTCKGNFDFEVVNYIRLAIVYSLKNQNNSFQEYYQLALSRISKLTNRQIEFLILNIEDFVPFLANEDHIAVLMQYVNYANRLKN